MEGPGPSYGRVVARDSLSLSLADACNPYCKRTHSGAGQHEAAVFPPLCSVSRQPIWAGARSDNLLVGPGTPRGQNADTYRIKKYSVYDVDGYRFLQSLRPALMMSIILDESKKYMNSIFMVPNLLLH
jgi:hypothetical protein